MIEGLRGRPLFNTHAHTHEYHSVLSVQSSETVSSNKDGLSED